VVSNAPAGTETPVARPLSAAEVIVARAWAEELRLPQVGLDEDFIDLGSHSLQGVAVTARLEQIFGVTIPVRVLFEEPTVADLAAWIERRRAELHGAWAPVRLQDGSSRLTVFAVPGGRGATDQLYVLAKLARDTDTGLTLYAFPDVPPLPEDTPAERWIATEAATLNRALRAVQPAGPYLLLGVCVGGIVAWEMARQLEDAGETVRLFLVDTRNPQLKIGEGTFRHAVTDALTPEERRARHRARREMRRRREPDTERSANSVEDAEKGSTRAVMARRYEPEPIAASLTLAVNQQWHRISPDLGWGELLGDRLHVVVLGLGHGLHWHVPEVAAALREWLAVTAAPREAPSRNGFGQ
jgi:thioesterase domain-containing protein/acyl carrier protein